MYSVGDVHLSEASLLGGEISQSLTALSHDEYRIVIVPSVSAFYRGMQRGLRSYRTTRIHSKSRRRHAASNSRTMARHFYSPGALFSLTGGT